MKTIYFYRKNHPYFELTNFSEHPISIDGIKFLTNEHYFQWSKFTHSEHKMRILQAKTPGEAKRLGASRQFPIRSDWDTERINVMRRALWAKFTQHPQLRDLLLSTGDAILIEDSPTDYFWGCGKNRTGRNMLGKLLMELRRELRILFK